MISEDEEDVQRFRKVIASNVAANDLAELRESLLAFGWIKELPAIVDQHGDVVDGHRRLFVAQELGIAPVFLVIDVGDDDGADARRLAYTHVANIGRKPLTPADRKRFAEALFVEKWSIPAIGRALSAAPRPGPPRSRTPRRGTVACARCGESFPQARSDARFCSTRCRMAAHRAPGAYGMPPGLMDDLTRRHGAGITVTGFSTCYG